MRNGEFLCVQSSKVLSKEMKGVVVQSYTKAVVMFTKYDDEDVETCMHGITHVSSQ